MRPFKFPDVFILDIFSSIDYFNLYRVFAFNIFLIICKKENVGAWGLI